MNPFMINNNTSVPDLSSIQNNPIFQMLKNRGMSNDQIVRYLCQQKGIDYNSLMEQARKLRDNSR